MLPFRTAHIGGAIAMAALGAILVFAVPADLVPHLAVHSAGWAILGWGFVWLKGEIVANGAAGRSGEWAQSYREAFIGGPALIGAAGTLTLILAPAHFRSFPLHTIGLIVLIAAVAWLVAEVWANGVRRSRGRSERRDETDPPVILS